MPEGICLASISVLSFEWTIKEPGLRAGDRRGKLKVGKGNYTQIFRILGNEASIETLRPRIIQ